MRTIAIFILTLLFLCPVLAQSQEQVNADAAAAMKAGNFDKAAKLYKKLTKAEPKNAEAWYQLSLAYLADKKDEKAADALEKATAINTKEPRYWRTSASVLISLDRIALAEYAAKKLIELQPNVANSYYFYAFISILKEEFLTADTQIEKMIALDPSSPDPYFLKGSLYLRQLTASQGPDEQHQIRAETLQKADAAFQRYTELNKSGPLSANAEKQIAAVRWFANFYKKRGDSSALDSGQSPAEPGTKLAVKKKKAPDYTREARRAGLSGVVILLVAFRADGTIGPILVLRGLRNGLTEKAVEAAKQIKFEPVIKNGVPIDTVRKVEYSFSVH